MNRAYRSEWLKLSQLGMILGGAGSIVAFGILTMLLTLAQLSVSQNSNGQGPGGASITSAQIASHTGFATLMLNSASFLGVVALVLFAISVGQEYSSGTLRNLIVRQPRRLQFLAGKLLAMGTFVSIAVVLAVAAGMVTALLLLPRYGISSSEWFTADGWTSLFKTTGNLVVATLAWGLLGAIIALLLRSTTGAIAIGLAYVLVVENLVTAAWSGGKQWLPGQILSAIAHGGNSSITYESAIVHAVVYFVVALAGTAWLFRQRDIAA